MIQNSNKCNIVQKLYQMKIPDCFASRSSFRVGLIEMLFDLDLSLEWTRFNNPFKENTGMISFSVTISNSRLISDDWWFFTVEENRWHNGYRK